MKKKLQHLTIVSMAIKCKCIPYSSLLEELDIKNVRDLEDLIIEAIYAGESPFPCVLCFYFIPRHFADIIHGKLDQKNKQLEVDNAIGRDIQPGDVSQIVNTLQEWCDSCETVLACIEEQIRRANSEKQKRIKHKDAVDKEVSGALISNEFTEKTLKFHFLDCKFEESNKNTVQRNRRGYGR